MKADELKIIYRQLSNKDKKKMQDIANTLLISKKDKPIKNDEKDRK